MTQRIGCITAMVALALLVVGCEEREAPRGTSATGEAAAAGVAQVPAPGPKDPEGTKAEAGAKAEAPAPKVADMKAYTAESLAARAKELGGKLTLVAVWATWCAPCIEEMPTLSDYATKNKDAGLRVIGLCMDDRTAMGARIQQVLDKQRVRYEMAVLEPGTDEAFMEAIDEAWDGTLPATILYDAQGKQVDFWTTKLDHKVLEERVGPKLR